MDRVFRVLYKIRDNYGAYIGKKSISNLATFISGFECGIYEVCGDYACFDSLFQRYIESVEKESDYQGKHWDAILLTGRDEESAFDYFYSQLERFSHTIEKTENENEGIPISS